MTNVCHLRPDGTFGVADLAVEGGLIAEVTDPGSQQSTMDCSGYVVLPGLVNGHFHSQTSVVRGLDTGLELFDWFGDSPGGRMQSKIGEWLDDPAHLDDVAALARYEYVAMLRQGVTFVADCGFSECPPGVLADVGDEIGVRALVQAYDDWICKVEDPARYTVNIDSEEDLTAAVLERTTGYLVKYAPIFALHCLETVKRRAIVQQNWGRSTVRLLADRGLLSSRTVLFHGCEIDADDLELVAKAGASIMHCPVSNLSIHGRIAPATDWFRAGVTVGLGTDWGDVDMWGTIRTAWLLQQTGSRPLATREDVLRMATRGGAVGYGRADLGEIAPGRAADLVFLDAARLRPSVHRADLSTLAFAIFAEGGPGLVREVMVGGHWVLRDGDPVRVDAHQVAADYQRIVAKLH
ncbi:amidohydrolase family protein [Fodinicola feengrottensis]